MKCIESHFLVVTKAICIAAGAVLFLAATARAAKRPHYGGTLRIELPEQSISLDPREWKPGSAEEANGKKLAALVFERLVTVDNYGRIEPQLALRWMEDGSSFRRWQFIIRPGVKFSDGTPLTATDVSAALQSLLPPEEQVAASGNTVVIQSPVGIPDLLEQLASGRYFVFHIAAGGGLVGTAPFIAERTPSAEIGEGTLSKHFESTPAATRLRFHANEEAWSGRPFVDAIDITLGVPPLRAIFDLQLGKTDLIELAPDLVHRAAQANLRIWASSPLTLLALRFDDTHSASSYAHFREALALCLDRGTMASVLLQKSADPSAALLPQWLSGYAFLFTMDTNLDRAKELRATLPAGLPGVSAPLRLQVDVPGELAKLLGERVGVNARQAGILLQVLNRPAPRSSSAAPDPAADSRPGLHLLEWSYSSLSARAELDSLAAAFNLTEPGDKLSSSTEAQQLYAREMRILKDYRVLPLVTLPEFVGLSSNIRDWMPSRWGEWHLADLWLDFPESAPMKPAIPNSQKSPPSNSQQDTRGSVSGERP